MLSMVGSLRGVRYAAFLARRSLDDAQKWILRELTATARSSQGNDRYLVTDLRASSYRANYLYSFTFVH
jgi:hypothetical protein